MMDLSALWQILLFPLSLLYGAVVWVRNWCYNVGVLQMKAVSVPVISVGNIAVGGTGKTPFVEYLVRYFLSQNKRIAVLSRGYRRRSRGIVKIEAGDSNRGNAELLGDEPYQIARKFEDVTVIVDEERARAAEIAVSESKADVILLDDGFQHRSLGRNLDIVLVDGQAFVSPISLLPAGRYREPLSSLKRADVLIVSYDTGVKDRLANEPCSLPRFEVKVHPKSLCSLDESRRVELHEANGKSCVAFCGIARPDAFRKTLSELRLNAVDSFEFADHHRYSDSDMNEILDSFTTHHADYLITTEKDAMRVLSSDKLLALVSPFLLYLEIETIIVDGEQELRQLCNAVLQKN